jgi:hypothetical protein
VPPTPLMNGKFSLYDTPDGGYVIAYQPEGDQETRRIEVPAIVVRMAKMASEGKLSPVAAMKGLISGS